MSISRGTLLYILGGTLGLIRLPGHLLHHGMTFLSTGWKTFPDGGALTVFIILIPGYRGLLVITPFLRYIIADLDIGRDITTNLRKMTFINQSQESKSNTYITVLVVGSHLG